MLAAVVHRALLGTAVLPTALLSSASRSAPRQDNYRARQHECFVRLPFSLAPLRSVAATERLVAATAGGPSALPPASFSGSAIALAAGSSSPPSWRHRARDMHIILEILICVTSVSSNNIQAVRHIHGRIGPCCFEFYSRVHTLYTCWVQTWI